MTREAAMNYYDLNDAAARTGDQRYRKGPAEVWYWKKEHARDMLMGGDWLVKTTGLPSARHLGDTHVLIGTVSETSPDEIYRMMQAENWSPEGEARGLISHSGSGHTTMAVGDVIRVGGKTLMVDMVGFRKLGSRLEAEWRLAAVDKSAQFAREVARVLGGQFLKVLPGGFRYSQPNDSSLIVAHTPKHSIAVYLVISVFEDDSTRYKPFSSNSLSEIDTFENLIGIDGLDTSDRRAVRNMARDIQGDLKTVDEYHDSWDEGDDEGVRFAGR